MSTSRHDDDAQLQRRHLWAGWSALCLFAALGVLLELLHAFKIAWYLGVASESRRLLFTLGHAHGAALGLVNLALAATAALLPRPLPPLASSTLLASTILLPSGFFLGGLFIQGSDPGLGAILIPIGALLLVLSLALIAAACRRPG